MKRLKRANPDAPLHGKGHASGSRRYLLPINTVLYRMAVKIAPTPRRKIEKRVDGRRAMRVASAEVMAKIRAEYKPHVMTRRMLAEKYGLSPGIVGKILYGYYRD